MFSQSVVEHLRYYVYFLRDPRNGEVFYIGKGKENRIFQHLAGAIETADETEKLDRIRDIEKDGFEVQHYVLRHGLAEEIAFEVQAALIDFVGPDSLSNIMGGRYSSDYGLKTAQEIIAQYEAKELVAKDPLLLINLNRLYRRDMTPNDLYEATRKSWVIGQRRGNAIYAVAHYRGLTREVYKIEQWLRVPENGKDRWAFEGFLAGEPVRNEYRFRSVKSYFKQGEANPIKFVNC